MPASESAGDTQGQAPHLADTLADVARLNEFLGDRALRRYQGQILRGELLTVRSPFTGQEAQPVALYIQGGASVIYRFEEGGRFSLSAAVLHMGYPITSITFDGIQLPCYGNALDEFSKRMLASGLYDEQPDIDFDPHAQPRIVTGSTNFAHCMWNEYPALRHLSLQKVKPRVSIMSDPLGAVEVRCNKLGLATDFLKAPHEARGWQAGPVSFIGALYCDAQAKADLLEDCGLDDLPDPVSEPISIYFTIRNRGRTVEDQTGFLTDLATRVLAQYPMAEMVFDGFSMPQDMDRVIYNGVRNAFGIRAEEGHQIVKDITARLPASARNQVIDLTGASLLEALKVIASCQYYVAHTGTSQHKIAWFFPRPGCIHSNEPSVRPSSLRWLVTQVHDCLVPFSPDPALIEDLDKIDLPNQVNRNKNYRIKDRVAYIDAILENMRDVLP